MKKNVELSSLIKNPDNPRIIKQDSLRSLIESVDKYEFMLSLKPVTIDEDGIIIGGNQRYEALKALGEKTISVQVYGHKEHEEQMLNYIDKGKEVISYSEAREYFIVKDNVESGSWDWDVLANNYENEWLVATGIDVWVDRSQSKDDFQPTFSPTFGDTDVTAQQIDKTQAGLSNALKNGTERKYIECICPQCAYEFNIDIDS